MIRFIDRLLYRLQLEKRKINDRNDLDLYLYENIKWRNELKEIAKDKFEKAITRIYQIIEYGYNLH